MIDRSLMVCLLTVLDERRDVPGGIEENALFNELNLRATLPVTTELLREHLNFAGDKDWISWKLDMLRSKRYRISQAGRNALTDFKEGC